MDLLLDTLEQIASSELSIAEIARANQVSTRWLDKVVRGQIAEPSVVKIQRLHEYLNAQADLRKKKRRAA